MSELRRWLEDAPPSEVRRLLEAGQWARPAGSVLEQTLLRVRAGAPPADASDLAVPADQSDALRAGIKWTLAGALLLGSIGALTYGIQSDEPSSRAADTVGQERNTPPVPPAPVAQAEAAPPASPPPAEVLVPLEPAKPAPQKPRGVAAPAAPDRASETARASESASRAKVCKPGVVEQISMLEQAKSLIQRGRGTDALAILDRYDAFGSGRCFVPESLKHRMDAYAQAGNSSGAARTATAIKKHYPDTAQARAADAVLKHK